VTTRPFSGTGHDLHARSGLDGGRWTVPGFEFAYAVESCTGMRIGRANCVAVTNRAVEGRVVTVGNDFLGDNAAKRIKEPEGFSLRLAGKSSCARDDKFAS